QIAGSPVTIGRPVDGIAALVLDARLNPVPPGVVGELYLAGVAMARGYHDRPDLTADRFVAYPSGDPGERMYRTGDLVRWVPALRRDDTEVSPGGWEMEFLGRTDFQVKIRGFRIELGEIDAVLGGHDRVEWVTTVGRENAAGAMVLVSYVLPVSGASLDPVALTEFAARSLPQHMVPAAVVLLDEVPLTAVGKVDRRALPEPELVERPYREPATPLERAVAEVFADVLGVERVGVDDDFFALGGTSLVATKAVSRLRTVTGAQLRVQWFFTDSTVAGLSRRIASALADDLDFEEDSEVALAVLLPIRAEGVAPALFAIHPLYGLSWCYTGFARYVGADRPVYGVQSPALSEPDYLPESLDELVARYVAEIRSVQPEGPYHLLGWSIGGVLAHAVAVALQAVGAEVGALVMLDSAISRDVTDLHSDIATLFAEMGVPGAALVLDGDDVDDLSEEALTALHVTIPGELAVITKERLRQIYRSAVRSARLEAAHEFGVFRGRLDYFSAEGSDFASTWRAYVDGAIIDHPVAASHEMLTSPEVLQILGPQVGELLDPK
ncbi:thioesterase domain-containing protein, partial [Nocardia sp. NPDC050710]|uniref:thioesterase domain-containing protein n=1 Tax=Nocardia sp. NPDC050710 TaxID=3157220 RepID=UPI00340C162B